MGSWDQLLQKGCYRLLGSLCVSLVLNVVSCSSIMVMEAVLRHQNAAWPDSCDTSWQQQARGQLEQQQLLHTVKQRVR